jgi:hypothetical protein
MINIQILRTTRGYLGTDHLTNLVAQRHSLSPLRIEHFHQTG